jgi:hypothetical protein
MNRSILRWSFGGNHHIRIDADLCDLGVIGNEAADPGATLERRPLKPTSSAERTRMPMRLRP